jgi:hypothetical protein
MAGIVSSASKSAVTLAQYPSFCFLHKVRKINGSLVTSRSTFQNTCPKSTLHQIGPMTGLLITEHISKLKPKPKYLYSTPVGIAMTWVKLQWDSIVKALNATDIVGIYKTTTFRGIPTTWLKLTRFAHDAHVCKSMQNRCVDVSWTKNLSGPVHYWDKSHRSHGNTAMNIQLLNLLDELHWHFGSIACT